MSQKLSNELQEAFLDVACALSPENLSGDGEYPKSHVRKRLQELRAEWKALEKKAGRKVTEYEVFAVEMQTWKI